MKHLEILNRLKNVKILIIKLIEASKSGEQEKAVLNPDDKDGVLLVSQDGYLAQNNTQQWAGVRANLGVMKGNLNVFEMTSLGKYYYEVTVSDGNLVRVGWSSRASKLELGKDKFLIFL